MEIKYNESNPLRVFEAFGGYGSQSMALKRLKRDFPCFDYRVVGYSDIDIIQSCGVSNSGQYKLAGNSIVVDVLYHIFRKAFVETENESKQLSLF